MVRTAIREDAGEIAEIYNYYILNDIATFEEDPISVEEMEQRMRLVQPSLPWIVYEESGIISGYAYAGFWNQRSAYRYTVESTVYLKKGTEGRGIGSNLYEELLDQLKKRKFKTVVGGISLPNPASQRLHEKFGYEKVAHFKKVGYKFGRWVDVGYWQLDLRKET